MSLIDPLPRRRHNSAEMSNKRVKHHISDDSDITAFVDSFPIVLQQCIYDFVIDPDLWQCPATTTVTRRNGSKQDLTWHFIQNAALWLAPLLQEIPAFVSLTVNGRPLLSRVSQVYIRLATQNSNGSCYSLTPISTVTKFDNRLMTLYPGQTPMTGLASGLQSSIASPNPASKRFELHLVCQALEENCEELTPLLHTIRSLPVDLEDTDFFSFRHEENSS